MNSNETDRSNDAGDTNGDKAKYLQEQKEVHSQGKTQESPRVSLTTLGNSPRVFLCSYANSPRNPKGILERPKKIPNFSKKITKSFSYL